jgi:hypothetical protein
MNIHRCSAYVVVCITFSRQSEREGGARQGGATDENLKGAVTLAYHHSQAYLSATHPPTQFERDSQMMVPLDPAGAGIA